MRKLFASVVLSASFAWSLPVDTSTVTAPDGSVSYLARPATKDMIRRPALVLAPEWWGLNEYAKRRARELAAEGYVVLAADFYGKRTVVGTPAEAGKLAGAFYGEPARFRKTMERAVEQLRKRPDVDTAKLGALGFCFGGTAALEAARAGLPFKVATSFHGATKPFAPTVAGSVKGAVQILHGGADPMVSMEDVGALVRDFEAAGADYSVVVYPKAVHAFTNPDAGSDPSKGAAYNAAAEKASFEAFHRQLEQSGLKP